MTAILFSSCEIDEFNFSPIFEREGEFQFQTEKTFCKSDPENEIWSKSFKYDNDGNLIEVTTFQQGTPDTKNTCTFNKSNQRLTDSTFYFSENGWIYYNSNQYIYSGTLLTEIRKYDAEGSNSHKTVYKYSGSKPMYEEFYYFTNEQWQFQYAHGFEFDRKGNLIKKSSYQSEAKG